MDKLSNLSFFNIKSELEYSCLYPPSEHIQDNVSTFEILAFFFLVAFHMLLYIYIYITHPDTFLLWYC